MNDAHYVFERLDSIFDGSDIDFATLTESERMRVLILVRGGVRGSDFDLGITRLGEVHKIRSAFGFICTAALNSAADREAVLAEARRGDS